jgi:hypothetical protein
MTKRTRQKDRRASRHLFINFTPRKAQGQSIRFLYYVALVALVAFIALVALKLREIFNFFKRHQSQRNERSVWAKRSTGTNLSPLT